MDKEKSMLHHCLYFTANALLRILIGANNNIRQLEENIGKADLKMAEGDIRALDGLTEVAAPYPIWMQAMGWDVKVREALGEN
jgi:hypothetical protein